MMSDPIIRAGRLLAVTLLLLAADVFILLAADARFRRDRRIPD